MKEKAILNTESYKGVRDFYPEDMAVQKYIFETWRKACESFGYVEYNASILEPTELYRSKTSDEIVNDQTYSFKDRGDRDVTLRPEMTPTVARMVAGKRRDLAFPLRWYSIPNVFRYEQPQKGRLREHWQLNADLFGANSVEADVEIISLAYSIMKSFGAKDEDFVIKINNRKILDDLANKHGLSEEKKKQFLAILDRKEKMPEAEFQQKLNDIIEWHFDTNVPPNTDTEELLIRLKQSGITNVVFSPSTVRGFEYYNGVVFEVFDTNKENRRSLFGGGRYDNLTAHFGGEPIPAIGFGMGDVTIRDFLETRNLLPTYKSPTQLFIATIGEVSESASNLANTLRQQGISVSLNVSDKKVGDQIKIADKQKIPFVLVVGEEEVKTNSYKIKNLESGNEVSCSSIEEIVAVIAK